MTTTGLVFVHGLITIGAATTIGREAGTTRLGALGSLSPIGVIVAVFVPFAFVVVLRQPLIATSRKHKTLACTV